VAHLGVANLPMACKQVMCQKMHPLSVSLLLKELNTLLYSAFFGDDSDDFQSIN
jgi:hypothetical protein